MTEATTRMTASGRSIQKLVGRYIHLVNSEGPGKTCKIVGRKGENILLVAVDWGRPREVLREERSGGWALCSGGESCKLCEAAAPGGNE